MVKEFLSQKGVGFQERDVSQDQAYANELMNKTGQMGIPVTIINQQAVIGFDRVRLEQLLTSTQDKQRPLFGASIADASKITAKQSSGIILGAYIGRVRTRSVADRMGLAPGDIITELNMKNIANAKDLEHALSSLTKGDRLSFVFLRGNNKMTTQGIY
jgi:S1-C subfamily serine protease